jgi:hypothetical protein
LFDVFLPQEQTWDLETLSSKSLSTSDGHFHQACLVEVRICSVVARKLGQETGSQTFVADSSICLMEELPISFSFGERIAVAFMELVVVLMQSR